MDTNKLSQKLRKCASFPNTPIAIFEVLRHLLPMVSVELFVREKNSFALVKKTGQFTGWALPGGYLGFNESIYCACQRIALRDLGIKMAHGNIISVFEWPEASKRGKRGHVISLLVECKAKQKNDSNIYFKNIPRGTLNHHKFMIVRALKLVKAGKNKKI